MRIVPVPCLKDNYAYLVVCEATSQAAVVDPSEAEPVIAALGDLQLVAIWNTHHHWDHTGGNKELLNAFPELEVVAHVSDRGRVPGQTTFAEEDDVVEVGQVGARIIHNPGHTTGAISYFIDAPRAVFTGDTLFGGGCGRLFEGTPEMMHASLAKLAALPEDTAVYCGHEYTVSNLSFAHRVEPHNGALETRLERAVATRERNEPTVPSTIGEERETNPFLRVEVPEVVAAARANDRVDSDSPAQIFGAIRRWKDRS